MAYVDDLSSADFSSSHHLHLQNLRRWWSVLIEVGPKFGRYPEPTKTWLVAKPCA